MRVLNVNMTLDLVHGGGTAERTFQISRNLARSGVECDLIVLDMGLTVEQLKALEGVRVHALPCVNRRFYVPKFSPGQIRQIVGDADVVHLMGHWTLVNALIYLSARYLRKPYVVCPAGALPIYGRSRRLKRLYNKLIGQKIVRDADGYVAIVKGEVPQFEGYGVPAMAVSVIPNGIELEAYRARERPALRDEHGVGDAPYVLFIGRLNEIKGPDLLLEAFAGTSDELSDHHLVFAGPDEGMLRGLRETARRAGLADRVHFIGHLGGEEKSRALHDAELLAVPSRQEAMSIVALEAGISGTPVLLTDRCGFGEVAEVGGGRVVPATSEGLRAGLEGMLKDPEGLREMGEHLRAFVGERYTWGTAVERYLKLYRSILGGTER